MRMTSADIEGGLALCFTLQVTDPDIQYHTKELASKLSSPTKGAMSTLLNVMGYLLYRKDIHVVMDGNDPFEKFQNKSTRTDFSARVRGEQAVLVVGSGNRFRLEWQQIFEVFYQQWMRVCWWKLGVFIQPHPKKHHFEQH